MVERSSDDSRRRQDLDLAQKAAQGDASAFRELFEAHRRRVFGIAWRFTRNREDALEIVQEVFIKVHRALHTFDGRSLFTTWLSRIATNASIDWTRRQKGDHFEYRDDLANPEGDPDAAPAAPRTEDPLDRALRGEVVDKVREALDSLSEKHRTIFLLNTVEGLSYKEIAETEDIPIGTVMSRLHYARKYLQEALSPYLDRGAAVGAGEAEDE